MHKYIHTLAGLYGNFIGFYPSPCRIITWMCWRSSITTITGCSLIVSLITNQQTPVRGTFSDYRKLIIYIYIYTYYFWWCPELVDTRFENDFR